MSRAEILRQEREKIMTKIANDEQNRAKLLAALIDIDDEMEELEIKNSRKIRNAHQNLSA